MPYRRRAPRALPAMALAAVFAYDVTTSNLQAGPLAPIWTGIYAGVHGGGNWIDIEQSGGFNENTEATVYGGYLGVNFGLGLAVIGLEADINYETASFDAAGSNFNFSSGLDASGTVRARLGLPVGPALLYATAGYAWTDYSWKIASGGLRFEGSDSFEGVVYGIGIESFVLPRVSLRLEALQYDFGSQKLSAAGAANAVGSFDPSSTVVRAGVTWHFN